MKVEKWRLGERMIEDAVPIVELKRCMLVDVVAVVHQ